MAETKRKLVLYASAFGAMVVFDGLKYLAVGGPNIINWQSFAHPAWVILAIAILAANIYFWRAKLFYFSFLLYFAVTIAALVNQYLPFWEILTYNCFLFNLVFTSIYFLIDKQKS